MSTTGSISQHSCIIPDIDKKICKDLGDEHIFFNVHKIYIGLESFTFESTMQINCGNVYNLKIVQTSPSEYNFKERGLARAEFKEIVEQLYMESVNSLQEHSENEKRGGWRSIPNITITTNVWSDYLSSMNYKDLYQSCFSV